MTKKSYFGLDVITVDGIKFIKVGDIKELPFFDFWMASAAGSTMRQEGCEQMVFLHDWEAFSELFISTGKHRHQAP